MSETVENGVTVFRGPSVPHIYTALVAVKKRMSEVGLGKNRDAPAVLGGYKFRGIDDLYNALCEVEAQEGVIVFPRIVAERTEYQTSEKGRLQTHVHLTMELKFVSARDGSSEIATAIGEGIDSGDKASGKAQSNAMKFGHLEVYKIPTEGLSPDIEAEATEVHPKAKPSLEKKLAASVGWVEWEHAQRAALLACPAIGDLTECWAKVAAEGRGAPEGMLKRLAETKNKLMDSLRKLQAAPQ